MIEIAKQKGGVDKRCFLGKRGHVRSGDDGIVHGDSKAHISEEVFLNTQFTVDSTNAVEIVSPYR